MNAITTPNFVGVRQRHIFRLPQSSTNHLCITCQPSCDEIECRICGPGWFCCPNGGCAPLGAVCCDGTHCTSDYGCCENIACGLPGNNCCNNGTGHSCPPGYSCHGAYTCCGPGWSYCPGAVSPGPVFDCCPPDYQCLGNGRCCPNGTTLCEGPGGMWSCCNPSYCNESCIDGWCQTCGGDPNTSCCNGNCCPHGCCENDLVNFWCVTRDCGCDPIGASCSGKTEKDAGPTTAYLTSGTGSKCKVPQGEILCYRWRSCVEAGYHDFEMCIVLNPDFPQGYCNTYIWPYCQDCEGTGEWRDSMTTSTRCVAP